MTLHFHSYADALAELQQNGFKERRSYMWTKDGITASIHSVPGTNLIRVYYREAVA